MAGFPDRGRIPVQSPVQGAGRLLYPGTGAVSAAVGLAGATGSAGTAGSGITCSAGGDPTGCAGGISCRTGHRGKGQRPECRRRSRRQGSQKEPVTPAGFRPGFLNPGSSCGGFRLSRYCFIAVQDRFFVDPDGPGVFPDEISRVDRRRKALKSPFSTAVRLIEADPRRLERCPQGEPPGLPGGLQIPNGPPAATDAFSLPESLSSHPLRQNLLVNCGYD